MHITKSLLEMQQRQEKYIIGKMNLRLFSKSINLMGEFKYLLVVIGPTAVGKTALCVKLAHQFQTDILSADSRQFFRELNIGTAKPSQDEMQDVKHYFINSH